MAESSDTPTIISSGGSKAAAGPPGSAAKAMLAMTPGKMRQ